MYCGNLSFNVSSSDLEQLFAEFGAVDAFAQEHWNSSYGDRGKMIEEVIQYKRQIFDSKQTHHQRIDKLADMLKGQFNEAQKKVFLEFLNQVMKADGIEETAEVDFYELFEKKLTT